jgi:hypothetical protein
MVCVCVDDDDGRQEMARGTEAITACLAKLNLLLSAMQREDFAPAVR